MKNAIKQITAAALFAFILCGPASSFSQRKNGGGASTAPAFDSTQTTAFIGVNVIPMDRERVLTNQTVVVRNGVIAEIGDAKKIKVLKGAIRVDGKGKYLIPGLVDMHTHLLSDGDEYPDSIAEDELKVMVANGVTTIRFMIGTPEQLELRTRSAKGEIIAPTIFSASPHITGREQGNNFVVKTADEAREAVRKSKAAGYDFIKVTTFIPAEAYEAVVDEAVKQNIRVVGHADSRFVGVERAWKARQQIEHLDGYMELLLRDGAPMKGSISDLYISDPKNWESLDYIDEAKMADVARKTVAANPYVNPTQHFMKNSFGIPRSEESIRAQPDFKFYPEKVQKQWLDFYKRSRMINQVPAERKAKWVVTRDKMIKAIHDAGGKLMAGSDTPEFLWLYGFAMHHELKALSDTGIGNYAALAAGTRNAHEFFGTIDRVGTIEKGKRADLILVNANPLENISATKDRAGVMLKGRWYAQTELNKWLDEIAPRIAGSHVPEKPTASAAALSVKYIANEGILLTSGDTRILIDGLHRRYGPEYAYLPDVDREKIEAAREPYDGIDLILVSHVHGDHFSPESVGLHLKENRNAVLATSQQVVDEVSAKFADYSAIKERIKPVVFSLKQREVMKVGGVDVEFLGVGHGSGRHASIHNLGHIVNIGGKKVLHVGDAELSSEIFDALDIDRQVIDVAFLPFWFLTNADGKAIVDQHIKARHIVAVHVGPDDADEVKKKVKEFFPNADIFASMLEERILN